MKHPAVIATLFFAATTALPAFAATPIMPPLRSATAPSMEMAQNQRAAPQQRVHRTDGFRSGNDALNAHASAPGPATNTRAGSTGSTTQHCVEGLEGSAASAYPMWEVCH